MSVRFSMSLGVILLCWIAVLPSAPVHAGGGEEIDWKEGKFGYLAQYAGTSDWFAVLDDPHVAAELSRLVGEDLAHLRENMLAGGTVGIRDDLIIINGNRPHEANVERAFVTVSMHDGAVQAAIYSNGRTTVYTDETNYAYLNPLFRMWIHGDRIYDIIAKPPARDFRWAEPAPRR